VKISEENEDFNTRPQHYACPQRYARLHRYAKRCGQA
jgi:hypothetical protein